MSRFNSIRIMIAFALFATIAAGSITSTNATDTLSVPVRAIGPWDIYSAALSSDGKKFIIGTRNGNTKLWDIATGKETNIFDGVAAVDRLTTGDERLKDVTFIAISPDGSKVITSTQWPNYNGYYIWDINTGKLVSSMNKLNTYEGPSGPVIYSHDGTMILSESDGAIALRNPSTGAVIKKINMPAFTNRAVSSLAFSPDDSKFIAGLCNYREYNGFTSYVLVWDVTSGEIIDTVLYMMSSYTYRTGVRSVAYSPDGKHIAFGLLDSTVSIQEVRKHDTRFTLRRLEAEPKVVSFSPDGSKLLTVAGSTACLWDARTGDSLRAYKEPQYSQIMSAEFFPDGSRIMTHSSYNLSRIWDVATGDSIKTFREMSEMFNSDVSVVTYSPDGLTIATAANTGDVGLWDVATGMPVAVLDDTGTALSPIKALACSSDGPKILAGSQSGTLTLWDVKTRTLKNRRMLYKPSISSLSFSADGSKFITASNDSMVRLWDTETFDTIRSFRSDFDNTVSALSPGGDMIVTGFRELKIWNAKTGEILHQFQPATADVFYCVVFSPDGSKLLIGATSGGYLLDTRTWQQTGRFDTTNTNGIESLAFSHDGTRFVIGRLNGVGGLWETATGKELYRFGYFGMENAWFSPDDSKLFSTGSTYYTAFVSVWDLKKTNSSARPRLSRSVSPRTVSLLSATRHTLTFSIPSITRPDNGSFLRLYQYNGRCVLSIPLQHASADGRFTVPLPENIAAGMYLYRLSGEGGSGFSGEFLIVR